MHFLGVCLLNTSPSRWFYLSRHHNHRHLRLASPSTGHTRERDEIPIDWRGCSYGKGFDFFASQTKKKRKRCGECIGCQRKDNCGDCAPCRNDKSHQICKQRRCEKLTEKKNSIETPHFMRTTLTFLACLGLLLGVYESDPNRTPSYAYRPSASRRHYSVFIAICYNRKKPERSFGGAFAPCLVGNVKPSATRIAVPLEAAVVSGSGPAGRPGITKKLVRYASAVKLIKPAAKITGDASKAAKSGRGYAYVAVKVISSTFMPTDLSINLFRS
ncbi:DNA N6-methyl adenine demethylase [Eumeta japonica]|uniref:DNA N6-methyl adenine demethylase n=1 Tax=Eumeta variegata TaxID=151549 RepID=A0A4C1TA10_EUMVA|nr:DNA N6-methyl adenine demethylase [Eumeta japonica]